MWIRIILACRTDSEQLSICLWTASGDWPTEVQELRAHLCSDAGKPFENDELNDQSVEVVKAFRLANKKVEEPPAKRRRKEVDKDTPSDLLNHLVMLLTGGSSKSPVSDLKNLHILVQYVCCESGGVTLTGLDRNTRSYLMTRRPLTKNKMRCS